MKDSTQLPWSTEEEFYDLHTNKFFSKDKFYHVYIIGSNDKEFADYIISKLNLTPESKVVDLGCGSGYLVSEISKICECIGISTSKQSIKKAKENYPHPNIYVHIGTEFIFQKKKREEWTNPYI
ncbi:MAG: methyltransferase domain-containing protein [Flavobacteriales bacterium]|nr:methyltransferase domain-containing protein [Flavobacteriales bacterium]